MASLTQPPPQSGANETKGWGWGGRPMDGHTDSKKRVQKSVSGFWNQLRRHLGLGDPLLRVAMLLRFAEWISLLASTHEMSVAAPGLRQPKMC